MSQGWRFCFIGGLVMQAWSEPRHTKDVDITLLTGFGIEELFIDALLARYRARRPDARDFALLNRVLQLYSAEDLIVMKAFAGPPQDWMDVRMTIVRQGKANLDWKYIDTQLRPLAEAKEAPEVLDQLAALRSRY